MGASFDEIVKEAEEESGLMRGGERFRQEKRKRIGKVLLQLKHKTVKEDHTGRSEPTVTKKTNRLCPG